MYGKPPFEEKEVENTLKNIKANKYSFPVKTIAFLEALYDKFLFFYCWCVALCKQENVSASNELRDFIIKTLVPNPDQRLTLDEMLAHPFLTSDTHLIPKYLPASTLALPPTLAYLRRLKKNTMENSPIEASKPAALTGSRSNESSSSS